MKGNGIIHSFVLRTVLLTVLLFIATIASSSAYNIDKSVFIGLRSDNNFANNTIKKDTSKVSSPPLSPSSNMSDETMIPCNDPDNGFSISYPSNWTALPYDTCIIFGPSWGQIFGNNDQTYVRISVNNLTSTNVSIPILSSISIYDLANDVEYFYDRSFFMPIEGASPSPVIIDNTNAFLRYYMSTGIPEVGLPYVNQFLPALIAGNATTTGNSSDTPALNTTAPPPSTALFNPLTTQSNLLTLGPTSPQNDSIAASTSNATTPTLGPTSPQNDSIAASTSNATTPTLGPTSPQNDSIAASTSNATTPTLGPTSPQNDSVAASTSNATTPTLGPTSPQNDSIAASTSNATTPTPGPTPTTGREICFNNTDDDTDGLVDRADPECGFPYLLAVIYILRDNKVYVIEYNAPSIKFTEHLDEVKRMINSFRFRN
jgi:hypothetical protein